MMTGKKEKRAKKRSNWKMNLLLLTVSIIISFIILELFLRVFNPFEFRIRANRIVLPANKSYVYENTNNLRGLDRRIVNTRNSLGFRGDNPPPGLDDYLSVIAVGGSTTECLFITDGKTWVDLLGKRLRERFGRVWINNAGLDGHSTFGHIILMEDMIVRLKPDYVLFMIGANDHGQEGLKDQVRAQIVEGIDISSVRGFFKSLAGYSEVFNLGLNLFRFARAAASGLPHENIRLENIEPRRLSEAEIQNQLQTHRRKYLTLFRARLESLIKISKDAGITPVFITQPYLLGPVIDPSSGADFSTYPLGDINGETKWRIIELYNDVTRGLARSDGVEVIDLAHEMPKDSKYFYDDFHFTNAGAAKVAELLAPHLFQIIERRRQPASTAPGGGS